MRPCRSWSDLLEDPVITLYYLGERPEALISAVQLPGKRFGVWAGEVEARATLRVRGRVGRTGPRDGRRAAGRGRHAERKFICGKNKKAILSSQHNKNGSLCDTLFSVVRKRIGDAPLTMQNPLPNTTFGQGFV